MAGESKQIDFTAVGEDTKQDLNVTRLNADVLVGLIPKEGTGLLDESLFRLTSRYEWKAMRVVLTDDGIHLARESEDVRRDMIPLLEILKTKKIDHLPGHEEERKSGK